MEIEERKFKVAEQMAKGLRHSVNAEKERQDFTVFEEYLKLSIYYLKLCIDRPDGEELTFFSVENLHVGSHNVVVIGTISAKIVD